MPDLSRLVGGVSPSEIEVPLYEAIVSNEPATGTDELFVTIPAFDPDLQHGPCPWSPRIVDGSTFGYPSPGDRAIVAVTTDQTIWVLEWWPT